MKHAPQIEPSTDQFKAPDKLAIKASEVSSAVLRRIIEEVKVENSASNATYNRVHNRHNRGR